MMRRFRPAIAAVLLAAITVSSAAAKNEPEPPAKELFGAATEPSADAPQVFGGYARGCVAGADALPLNGPDLRWQKMRLNRNRPFGHPALIAFIDRLSTQAQAIGWGSLLIGDMAQARGGPMLTGHRSHQTGIDVDIWMLPGEAREYSVEERDTLSSISVLGEDRRSVNGNWTLMHQRLLRDAATDPAVARIFVNAAIKKAMCVDSVMRGADTAWLRKVRPWYGHHYHFHVRLNCPESSPDCKAQDAPPPGDGCDESLDWWLSDAVLNPPPPKPRDKPRKKREPLTLAQLHPACRALVGR